MILAVNFTRDGIQAHTKNARFNYTNSAWSAKNLFQLENPAKLSVFLDFPI